MSTGEKPSRFRAIIDFLKWLLLGDTPAQPGDPDAYVMAPVRRGPKGRSGAAVAEIEEDSDERDSNSSFRLRSKS